MKVSPFAISLHAPATHARAHATLVLRHAGGAMVAQLSPSRSITVGRRLPADVIIDDQSLALQHARFSFANEGLSVEDLGSRSGTWVAGRSVKQAHLRSGESVQLGDVTATVHVAPRPTDDTRDARTLAETVVISPRTAAVFELAGELARTSLPILILGEPGTGKQTLAATVHARSDQADAAFTVFDCTQGTSDAPASPFADGGLPRSGTLLLLHVGSLDADDQSALLRVLQEGSHPNAAPSLRIIATESGDLAELAATGRFRDDLLARLSAVTLRIPPLRERTEEIDDLVRAFLARAALTWARAPRSVDPSLVEHLKRLPWHGNLKQLRTAIEHADLVCPSNAIGVQDLPCELLDDGPASLSSVRAGSAPVPPTEREAAQQNLDFKGRVREYEIRMIVDGLKHTGGNQRAAARLLRIPLRTLAHKIKAYRIKHRLATEVARERGVSA